MSWLTNWDEAAHYPRRTRLFVFVGFAAVVFLLATVTSSSLSAASAAGIGLMGGLALTALVEPFVRRRLSGAPMRHDTTAVVTRQVVVAVVFALAVATTTVTHSALVGGLLATAGVAALSLNA